MKIHRIDHVGIIVNDLSAAKAFFLDFGLEVQGEGEMEGELVGYAVGLNDVKVAMCRIGNARRSDMDRAYQILYAVR